MGKVIAAINITIDGVFDHTAITPDQEIHRHYADLLDIADVALYGRITFQLMEFWKGVVQNPTGIASTDEFAQRMDALSKIVFSSTLKKLDWASARLSCKKPEEEIAELKLRKGKSILVGSRSLMLQLMNQDLIDEYQFMVHPVIAGKGNQLFNLPGIHKLFRLQATKVFGSGAILLVYGRS